MSREAESAEANFTHRMLRAALSPLSAVTLARAPMITM